MSFSGLSEGEQRKLLSLCFEIVASVSNANLAKRGTHLNSTLVDPFAIRELADMLEELSPGAADKVREARAAQIARARAAWHAKAVERARQLDAQRAAEPVDSYASRALPQNH